MTTDTLNDPSKQNKRPHAPLVSPFRYILETKRALKEKNGDVKSVQSVFEESVGNRRCLQRLAQSLVKKTENQKCASLEELKEFLTLDWKGRQDDAFFVGYREVLVTVASMMPVTIQMIIYSMLQRFQHPSDELEDKVHEEGLDLGPRACKIIAELVKLVPPCTSFIMAAAEFHFPFHQRSVAQHVCYVTNLLLLATVLPTFRYKLLELVLGKALILDVVLQNDAELLLRIDLEKDFSPDTEEGGEEEETGCGPKAKKTRDSDEVEAEAIKRKRERKRRNQVRAGTKKLDLLLEMIFVHIQKYIMKDSQTIDEKNSKEMSDFVLGVFERTVLPTFKSRYLQFLALYMASIRPALADQFLGLLFRPVINFCQGLDRGRNAQPTPSLLLSVAHIGSFVARSRFLSDQLLQLAFETLVNLITRLLARTALGPPGILPIITFQNIMYIFLWRHQDLLKLVGEDQIIQLFELIFSEASILLHCNPQVVIAFLDLVTDKLVLLDDSLREEYQYERKLAGDKTVPTKFEDLETYFPYDPILGLPKTSAFITPDIYQLEPPQPPSEPTSQALETGEDPCNENIVNKQ